MCTDAHPVSSLCTEEGRQPREVEAEASAWTEARGHRSTGYSAWAARSRRFPRRDRIRDSQSTSHVPCRQVSRLRAVGPRAAMGGLAGPSSTRRQSSAWPLRHDQSPPETQALPISTTQHKRCRTQPIARSARTMFSRATRVCVCRVAVCAQSHQAQLYSRGRSSRPGRSLHDLSTPNRQMPSTTLRQGPSSTKQML